MFSPVLHRIPYTVPTGAGTVNSVLETRLATVPVLDVTLLFINTHPSASVDLTIVERIDLGVSDDAEDDGVIVTTVVDVTIEAGERYTYTPPMALSIYTDTPSVEHLISLVHEELTEQVLVQLFVCGKIETTVRTNIDVFSRSS